MEICQPSLTSLESWVFHLPNWSLVLTSTSDFLSKNHKTGIRNANYLGNSTSSTICSWWSPNFWLMYLNSDPRWCTLPEDHCWFLFTDCLSIDNKLTDNCHPNWMSWSKQPLHKCHCQSNKIHKVKDNECQCISNIDSCLLLYTWMYDENLY